MFKAIGCSRVLCSSIMFFSYETLTDLITLQFINQSIYILSNLKYCVMLGKTYDRFFNELDKNRVYFYKNFALNETEKSFLKIKGNFLINKNVIEQILDIFKSLGMREKKREIEYISACVDKLENLRREYARKYDCEKQISLLTGISAGVVLIIMLY